VALTATQDTYDVVVKRLSMTNPYIVALSPDRPNILLKVRGSKSLTEFANQMASALKEKQIDYPETIIFFP